VLARQAEAELRGLTVKTTFCPAPALGDARLAERLIANLADNAMRHNVAHGTIQLSTGTWAGHAVLSVSNTGPVLAPEHLARLFQPFHRGGGDRTGSSRDGLGLGLSMVAAIAAAHGAWLQANALAGGGLTIQVGFPQPPCPPPRAAAPCPPSASVMAVASQHPQARPVPS